MRRLTIWVVPGSRKPGVGGTRDGALVVRVRERAVEGRATDAALTALAAAIGVQRRELTLVRGATSRTKVIEVAGGDERVGSAVAKLAAGQ